MSWGNNSSNKCAMTKAIRSAGTLPSPISALLNFGEQMCTLASCWRQYKLAFEFDHNICKICMLLWSTQSSVKNCHFGCSLGYRLTFCPTALFWNKWSAIITFFSSITGVGIWVGVNGAAVNRINNLNHILPYFLRPKSLHHVKSIRSISVGLAWLVEYNFVCIWIRTMIQH